MITVLVVDDHEVVRLGLQTLLELQSDIRVVGQAASAEEAVVAVERLRPMVVLLDVRLPGSSGIDACRTIRRRWPHTRVIILTSYIDDSLVAEAIGAGADGYVLKKIGGAELVDAIRDVAAGRAALDAGAAATLVARVRDAETALVAEAFRDLTERELDVLALLCKGRTNAEIARELQLSEKTVANHVSAVFDKLGVGNRVEAASYGMRHHIDRLRPSAGPE